MCVEYWTYISLAVIFLFRVIAADIFLYFLISFSFVFTWLHFSASLAFLIFCNDFAIIQLFRDTYVLGMYARSCIYCLCKPNGKIKQITFMWKIFFRKLDIIRKLNQYYVIGTSLYFLCAIHRIHFIIHCFAFCCCRLLFIHWFYPFDAESHLRSQS